MKRREFRPNRDTDLDFDREWQSELLVQEYASVRAEAIQSFENSQSIIQWSLATYGVLFGAGLIASRQEGSQTANDFVAYAALVIFSLVLPGLVCAATWQWLGEITRMERTGVFLRGLEHALRSAGHAQLSPGLRFALNWETFLVGGPGRKRLAPYLGTAIMFAGSLLSSVAFAFMWLWSHFGAETWRFPNVAWIIAATSILVLYFWVSLTLGVSVLRLGRQQYDFGTGDVISIQVPEAS